MDQRREERVKQSERDKRRNKDAKGKNLNKAQQEMDKLAQPAAASA